MGVRGDGLCGRGQGQIARIAMAVERALRLANQTSLAAQIQELDTAR
jgi:hypothetical protein